MPPALLWLRLYTEFAGDPKVQILAFEDQRHYVILLCLKGNGTLDSATPSESYRDRIIAKGLGLDLPTALEAKRRLQEAGLIDATWQPVKWSARQFKSDHDAAERKRNQRLRESQRDSHNDVTTNGRDSHALEQSRAEQSRAEQSRGRKRAGARQTATRLPVDFGLTPERRAVAEAEKLPADRTFQRFCDHWRAASGTKARKHDWDATWRNWCTSEYQKPAAKEGPVWG